MLVVEVETRKQWFSRSPSISLLNYQARWFFNGFADNQPSLTMVFSHPNPWNFFKISFFLWRHFEDSGVKGGRPMSICELPGSLCSLAVRINQHLVLHSLLDPAPQYIYSEHIFINWLCNIWNIWPKLWASINIWYTVFLRKLEI